MIILNENNEELNIKSILNIISMSAKAQLEYLNQLVKEKGLKQKDKNIWEKT